MEQTEIKKKKPAPINRVMLSLEAADRVEEWTKVVKERVRGSRFTKNDLVSDLIMEKPQILTNEEIERIAKKYFNLRSALLWAARKLKEVQSKTEEMELQTEISSFVPKSKKPKNKPTEKKLSPKKESRTTTTSSSDLIKSPAS